jgi:hypothetical protein
MFANSHNRDNPPGPSRVFRKLVDAGDVCERDSFADLEA